MSSELKYDEFSSILDSGSSPVTPSGKFPFPTGAKRKHTPSEMRNVKNVFIQGSNQRGGSHQRSNLTPESLFEQFGPINKYIGEVIRDNERFREVCPEISEATEILVSTIVAPTDLQEGNPPIILKDEGLLTDSIHTKIEKYISDYFNNDLELGKKLKRWIRESLVTSGAKAVAVLPERVLSSLLETDVDRIEAQEGAEALKEFNQSISKSKSDLNEFSRESYISLARSRAMSQGYSGIGYEDLQKKDEESFLNTLELGLEQFSSSLESKVSSKTFKDSKFKSAVESIAVNFATKLNMGDTLHISENPEILRFGKKKKDDVQDRLVKAYYGEIGLLGRQTTDRGLEPFISLLNYDKQDESSKGHPLVIELPTESVIPVCVPGSTSDHLGYFVLIDEYGNPLEASKYLASSSCSPCSNNAAENAFSRLYGKDSNMGASDNFSFMSNLKGQGAQQFDPKKSAIADVFDYVLDTMLIHRLKNMGLGSVDIGKMNSISECMLYRFLEKKETCLVFVPAAFMMYLAYDYRNDGTGKSILENIGTLLSIRTTLIVAGMLSAANASIPYRTVSITTDENDVDWEQTLEMAKAADSRKHGSPLSVDVDTIIGNLHDSHRAYKISGVGEVDTLDVEKTSDYEQANRVDDNLMETLTKMIITALDVPPATLNQLGEHEYSRSVATTNIYYANKNAIKQQITEEHVNKFIRMYILNDPILLQGIASLLKGSNKHVEDLNAAKQSKTEKKNEPINFEQGVYNIHSSQDTTSDDIMFQLNHVVHNLYLSLPTPNLAADKNTYDEISSLLDLIDRIVDKKFSPDLVGVDSELRDAHTAVVALAKKKLFEQMAENISMVGSLTIPSLEDLILESEEIAEASSMLRNLNAKLQQDITLQTSEEGQGDDSGGDYGGGDDYSSDDDSGGDDDDDMGGGDDGWSF